ncbi:penicillin-binding protein [Corynebacterium poyangense]|uniref:Penicillin-binding protein n=1 Tax=Corynebacterium poyangense TaxID=2684405 RepID=A0A7H0SLL7_9CORY|nr:transglycosylase domain-containing protein [Corynebacterium poyangense]QNQ89442.1 penicillin-binding protein [Corynebacterium poyangense]
MSVATSLKNLLLAMLAATLVLTLALVPFAGASAVAISRTSETMQSNLADMTDGSAPGVSTITDTDGNPIAWIYAQRRYPVKADQIPQSAKDAIVAIEDRRFYEHDGVDLQGTARAMLTNIVSGGIAQGASTLDQQYVKNYLLLVSADDPESQAAAVETSIPRKLREMRMASDLDKILSKDEIVTRYLNLVPFGNGAFGIEAAARTYFGKSAAELTVPQSAMLAGMVQSSSALNPYTNPEGVTQRRNTVLDAMVDAGYLDQDQAQEFKAEELGVLPEPQGLPNGCISAGDRGFFCDYALTYLEQKGLSKEQLLKGGYTIRTTLEPHIQDAAHQAVSQNVSPTQPGIAEVTNVIEPGSDSRKIRAMASSRNYGLNPDNAETVLPQPTSMVGNGAGSVFKVFTAAAALEKGIGLDTMLNVPPRYEATGMGSGGAQNCPANTYCVENSGSYKSRMTLTDALAQSPNTPFVQMIQQVGVPAVVDLSVKLGLRSYANPGTWDADYSIADYMKKANLGSYTLGPTAVNPLELSNVGATLASGGKWCEPNPIESVTDASGQEVALDRPQCEQAVSEDVAQALTAGLSKDYSTGTAKEAAQAAGWKTPIASKTGTTESHQSAAFLGYNSGFAAATYIYNDGTSTAPLCTGPARQCSSGTMFGGMEPARTWFAMAQQVPAAVNGGIGGHNPSFNLGANQNSINAVVGMSEADATRTLQEQGFRVTTRMVFGNGTPRGTVMNAASADGGPLTRDNPVVLEVSDGRSRRPDPNLGQPVPDIQTQIDQLTRDLRNTLGF